MKAKVLGVFLVAITCALFAPVCDAQPVELLGASFGDFYSPTADIPLSVVEVAENAAFDAQSVLEIERSLCVITRCSTELPDCRDLLTTRRVDLVTYAAHDRLALPGAGNAVKDDSETCTTRRVLRGLASRPQRSIESLLRSPRT